MSMCHEGTADWDLLYFLKRTDSYSVLAVSIIVNRTAYLSKRLPVPFPLSKCLSTYFVSGTSQNAEKNGSKNQETALLLILRTKQTRSE